MCQPLTSKIEHPIFNPLILEDHTLFTFIILARTSHMETPRCKEAKKWTPWLSRYFSVSTVSFHTGKQITLWFRSLGLQQGDHSVHPSKNRFKYPSDISALQCPFSTASPVKVCMDACVCRGCSSCTPCCVLPILAGSS